MDDRTGPCRDLEITVACPALQPAVGLWVAVSHLRPFRGPFPVGTRIRDFYRRAVVHHVHRLPAESGTADDSAVPLDVRTPLAIRLAGENPAPDSDRGGPAQPEASGATPIFM